MEKEDSITLNTGHNCSSCKNGNVFTKFTKYTMVIDRKVVYGGRGEIRTHADMVVTYFCRNCGVVFMPTRSNNLAEKLDTHVDFALKVLDKTRPCLINRVLLPGEVFEELVDENKKQTWVMFKDVGIDFFEIGSIVRVIKDEAISNVRNIADIFNYEADYVQYPYIVPNDSGSFDLVWWAKQVRQDIPLTKEERAEKRKALKARLSKLETERDLILEKNKSGSLKQKISAISAVEIPSLQNEIKNLKSKTKLVFVDNDPLPQGSVMAESFMILDFLNKKRLFYVPVNALD